MPVWKLQCALALDSVFPRDRMIITPHFNDGGVGSDPQGLCNDMADALVALWTLVNCQIEVTAYDAQGTPPVAPQGYAIRRSGLAPAVSTPREIACCLSFYSGFNRPRLRGRLYIPYAVLGTAAGLTGRPSSAIRTSVGALAPVLQDLGGPDVDWSVYSRVDDVARPVTNWWVDDEWDTVRSRGLRPTTRLTGVTAEA